MFFWVQKGRKNSLRFIFCVVFTKLPLWVIFFKLFICGTQQLKKDFKKFLQEKMKFSYNKTNYSNLIFKNYLFQRKSDEYVIQIFKPLKRKIPGLAITWM